MTDRGAEDVPLLDFGATANYIAGSGLAPSTTERYREIGADGMGLTLDRLGPSHRGRLV